MVAHVVVCCLVYEPLHVRLGNLALAREAQRGRGGHSGYGATAHRQHQPAYLAGSHGGSAFKLAYYIAYRLRHFAYVLHTAVAHIVDGRSVLYREYGQTAVGSDRAYGSFDF